jgi:hypothetical protein
MLERKTCCGDSRNEDGMHHVIMGQTPGESRNMFTLT